MESAIKDVVNSFYHNLAMGRIKANESLLRTMEVATSGIHRGNSSQPARAWSKTPAQYLARHGDKPKFLKIDTVQVDLVHQGFAIARIQYHEGGQKGYAVLTLAREDQAWKITSLYEETHFVW